MSDCTCDHAGQVCAECGGRVVDPEIGVLRRALASARDEEDRLRDAVRRLSALLAEVAALGCEDRNMAGMTEVPACPARFPASPEEWCLPCAASRALRGEP